MTIRCKAVHEKGVLRPEKPLELAEGECVELIVVPANGDDRAAPELGFDARKAAAMLARIAAMPLEVDDKGFSGRDHDKVLYGKKD